MRILYVTDMTTSKTSGINIAVWQLMNTICNYAEIDWLNLNDNVIPLDERINRKTVSNYLTGELPDIAVFEDPFNTVMYCRIARELKGKRIPYIITPHGCFHKEALKHNHLKKIVAMNTIFRGFLHGCYGVQYLCENEMNNSYKVNEAIIISNGIPESEEFRVRKAIKDIVFISRKAVSHKGLDLLLQSLKAIKDLLSQKGVRVHLYGSVETEQDENYIIKTIKDYGLGEIVDNNGPVFDEEKKSALMKADLFVLTSRHEGFPMSILESFTYGLPVLITDCTNMGDIVTEGNAGWVCHATVEDISRTIAEALETQDCAEISMNAKRIGSQFSWDEIAKQTIDTYSKIAQSK